MKAWYKEVNEEPRLIDIENELFALQQAVEGYIQCYALSPTETVICNEDGLLTNKHFNCIIDDQFFFGPLLIVGINGEEFTDTQLDEITAKNIFMKRRKVNE